MHLISKNEFDSSAIITQQEVELLVDGNLRFKHAALHTAGHLIDFVISRVFCFDQKIINPQGNHFPDQAKVVYDIVDGAMLELEKLKTDISQQVNSYIVKGMPIEIFSDSSERKRMIRMGDDEAVGCGGTHLPNTRYIEHFEIRQIKIKKGKLIVAYDCKCSDKIQDIL